MRVAHGYCSDPSCPNRTIELYQGLKGKKLLRYLIHEILHGADFHKTEEFVNEVSKVIAHLVFDTELRDKIFENKDKIQE